jgi:murein DD-endopeptidase MepM/ murein hydrolase activator NlpD
VSIGDIQVRIAAIQSSITALAPKVATAAPAGVARAAGTTGAAHVHSASAAAFATALDKAQPGTWVKPVNGRVTSDFGHRWGTHHAGIDIAAATGTPVRSMGDGTVLKAGWNNGGYGNFVVVDHGNGVHTRYAHNSEVEVKAGQRVKAGDVIAKAGSTGDSTGPHLHLEIQVNGKKVDPRPWMTERGIKL